MRRREFIAALASASAWPLALRAQQRIPVVGIVSSTVAAQSSLTEAFRQGLRETGFIEGQNVLVEYRYGQNQPDRLRELVADLIKRDVAVIASVGGTRMAMIGKAATSTIPVIFEVGDDPVRNGLVASFNRPGGNLTGVNSVVAELWMKQIELISNVLPNSRIFGILAAGGTPDQLELLRREAQHAADAVGWKLPVVAALTPQDIDEAFPALRRQGAEALIVRASPLSFSQREQLAALAARYSLPAIYAFRANVEAGGLMSYGIKIEDSFRLVGVYTGRILKGEKPADLPVVQPTRFEFLINLKTAKALGLEIPHKVLALADEVIE